MTKAEMVDKCMEILQGWRASDNVILVLVERPDTEMTKGGIVLAQDPRKNYQLLEQGMVLECGSWTSLHTGSMIRPAGFIPAGTMIQFAPNNDYRPMCIGGRDVAVIRPEAVRLWKKGDNK